jgi:ABC-type sugar transport system substrate-binding protein
MNMSIRTVRAATLSVAAVAAMAIGSSSAALAQHHGRHWHGGGRGPGFAGGLAVGTAIGASPYYYGGPYAYDYGGCSVRRQVVINRWGQRVIRHIRVCD